MINNVTDVHPRMHHIPAHQGGVKKGTTLRRGPLPTVIALKSPFVYPIIRLSVLQHRKDLRAKSIPTVTLLTPGGA